MDDRKREPRPLLPATFREVELSLLAADALAYARNCVRIVRDEKINAFGVEAFFFQKLDNRRLGVEVLKFMAKWPQGMIDLANFGRARWDLADQALRELILEYGHRNEPMPIPLHAYNLEITDPRYVLRRQPGKKKADYLLRDIAIVAIVVEVCWKFGLKLTRDRASKRDRPSGSKIVAQALSDENVCAISEDAVVAIVQRYGRDVFPEGGIGPPWTYPWRKSL